MGTQDDIHAGEFAAETVECRMVLLSGVFPGKGLPEAMELCLRHVEDPLDLFHGGIYLANLEQVADIEQGIAMGEAVQVYPVGLLSGQEDVAELEIPVDAVAVLRDGFGKCTNDPAVLLAYESCPVDGAEDLLLPAGEEIRMARRRK